MTETTWPVLEGDPEKILAVEANPIRRLAEGSAAAVVIRGAFPPAECAALVRHLIERDLMYDENDPRVQEKALDPGLVDRWTKQGLNAQESGKRRIDIGSSLGNLGDDRDAFLEHSAGTHKLFAELFAGRADPVKTVYGALERISPGKRVVTAQEPDGRQYGPAIFRVHYGGYTYGPHFDSVRLRESRSQYAVYKYETQLAGVLCVQNAVRDGIAAQGILHRQFWNPEIDPLLKSGRFPEYAAEKRIEKVQLELEPGDLYFFNTGLIHEVPGVSGTAPRVVLAMFIGYSPGEEEMMVWS